MSCDYELMTLLLPEEEYPMEPFLWYLPAVQIWCSFLLLDWRYRDFKLVILLTLSSSKLIFILITLGKSKLSLFVFSLIVDRSQLIYSVWVRDAVENNPNPLCLIKIQEPRIGFGTSYFQWFNQWKSRTGFLSQ